MTNTLPHVLGGSLHLGHLATESLVEVSSHAPSRPEIMRDSRVGTFGLVAIFLLLLGDWADLSGMPPLTVLAALLAAAAMSRLAVVCVLVWLPYARPEGLAAAAHGGPPLPDLAVA